jgi:S1-C subfamily serine protease
MSESDQTWNAGGQAGGEGATPPEHAWPQYSWTEADESTAATPAADAPAPASDSVSWPPTQPTPAAHPTAVNPVAPGAYAAGPYGPGPYANGPYGSDPNPSGPYAWPPAGPAPATTAVGGPPAPVAPKKMRRGLAALAALALVLASAGVGAGVAIAVHNDDNTRIFSAAGNTLPDNGSSNNGSSNNGGSFTIPNNGGSFTVPGTNGSNNNGTGTLDINAIASKVNPALVNINTTLAQGRAAGTGMLISSTGEILTNNHVIADATSIKVTIGGVGNPHDAKVVGYDVSRDVALIQITDKVSDLPTVVFGEPSKAQIGDPVVAIGNALGQGGVPKATQGHVTALDQRVTAGDQGGAQETLEGMIQINAPIQPGDSGGALVDAGGKVIGMNTAAAGGGNFNSQGSSIGFAIPIDNAVDIVSQIQTGNDTDTVHIGDRAMLGVQAQDVDGANSSVSAGALVVGVQDGTGAAAAGLKTNDVIVSINGKAIADSAALRETLSHLHPGDSVDVGWVDSSNNHHDAGIKLVVGPPL